MSVTETGGGQAGRTGPREWGGGMAGKWPGNGPNVRGAAAPGSGLTGTDALILKRLPALMDDFVGYEKRHPVNDQMPFMTTLFNPSAC